MSVCVSVGGEQQRRKQQQQQREEKDIPGSSIIPYPLSKSTHTPHHHLAFFLHATRVSFLCVKEVFSSLALYDTTNLSLKKKFSF